MQPEQLVLPALATAALGAALIVPLRDGPIRSTSRKHGAKALRLNFRTDGTPGTAFTVIGECGRRLEEFCRAIASLLTPPLPCIEATAEASIDCDDTVIERSFESELAALLPVVEDTAEYRDPPVTESRIARAHANAFERAVPLTRVPLRSQPAAITWTASFEASAESRADRHALLRGLLHDARAEHEPALIAAYREEDAEGRLIALRALRGIGSDALPALLRDALRLGSDDERLLAVDALLAAGEREAVTVALCDRLDAIAARAALGYVGTNARADYVRVLEPYVGGARTDAILLLLAGIVE